MKSCQNCPLRNVCPRNACADEYDAHVNSGLMRSRLRGRKVPFWTKLGRRLASSAGNRRAVVLALVD
jgi:hypothetical protein